jgi:hypothetical protein
MHGHAAACGGMRWHAVACCGMRWHAGACGECGGMRRNTGACGGMRGNARACGGMRRNAGECGGMRWARLVKLHYKPEFAGSVSDDVPGIFHWPTPSGRNMALGSAHPLTEMSKAFPLRALTGPEVSRKLRLPDFKTIGTSTRDISWGVKAAGALN